MNKTTLNSQKEKHSLLSLRRATFVGLAAHRLRNISIHALLAESDTSQPHCAGSFAISIHALLAESDPIISSATSCRWLFLSTLSLRRATFALALNLAHVGDFYPRSPCGERHTNAKIVDSSRSISIHALLAESDAADISTRREASISIHALLAESDGSCQIIVIVVNNFYPRSPCGERHTSKDVIKTARNFYPRSPCGERRRAEAIAAKISHFYPRSPCGERPIMYDIVFMPRKFLSTLSLRRATARRDSRQHPAGISIHALLAESDT